MIRNRLLIAILSVSYLASVPHAIAELFERSHALVIGIDNYPNRMWPSLPYAIKDAKGMAAFLTKQGFEVTMLLDEEATRANIIDVVDERLAPELGDRDRILVFFSGHGETKEIGGRDFGYIVPYDGGASISSWISMDQMREISRQLSNAHHQLFIFDSCYGGQFAVPRKGALSSVPESHPRYIEKISASPARLYITAGGKGELVLASGPKGYSYFTGYLLEALEGAADLNGDTYITSSELDAYLQPRATNWDHTPIAGVLPEHGQGNFWFRTPDALEEPGVPTLLKIQRMISPNSMKRGRSAAIESLSDQGLSLMQIDGIGQITAHKLIEQKLDTVEKLAALSDEEIRLYASFIQGVSEFSLRTFRKEARELLNQFEGASG